ncbi:MAG: FtsX-like permease family protein, partial [Promethearchaeota archaeon]
INLETEESIPSRTDINGIAIFYLKKEMYLLTVFYNNNIGYWNGSACINTPINVSKIPFIQITINQPIDLKIIIQDEFETPINQTVVSIEGVFSGATKTSITNTNGTAVFSSITWDKFIIKVGRSDVILESEVLIDSTTITIIYPSDESKQADYSRWVSHRKYAVENPVEYVGGFLETSFAFLNIVLFSLVALITTLIFLSFGPIVSHPIHQSKSELLILRNLGTDLSQRRRIFIVQLSLTCTGASLCGSILGLWAVLSIDRLKTHIIGGLAINPIFHPGIVITIVLVSTITTIWNIYRAIRNYEPVNSTK